MERPAHLRYGTSASPLLAGQGIVSALLFLVYVHMDDALVPRALALECIAVALKARVSVEERRDGRLVLGRKVRVPTRVILNLAPQLGSGQAIMSSVPIQSASCRGRCFGCERALLAIRGGCAASLMGWLALCKRMPYSFSRESVRKLKGHVAGVPLRRAKRTRKLTPESASAMPRPV